ncbi:hypothetical protein JCM11641_001027 [Rhodosporidiobolus odoratus]
MSTLSNNHTNTSQNAAARVGGQDFGGSEGRLEQGEGLKEVGGVAGHSLPGQVSHSHDSHTTPHTTAGDGAVGGQTGSALGSILPPFHGKTTTTTTTSHGTHTYDAERGHLPQSSHTHDADCGHLAEPTHSANYGHLTEHKHDATCGHLSERTHDAKCGHLASHTHDANCGHLPTSSHTHDANYGHLPTSGSKGDAGASYSELARAEGLHHDDSTMHPAAAGTPFSRAKGVEEETKQH